MQAENSQKFVFYIVLFSSLDHLQCMRHHMGYEILGRHNIIAEHNYCVNETVYLLNDECYKYSSKHTEHFIKISLSSFVNTGVFSRSITHEDPNNFQRTE